jgi:hypothetical protein
MLLRVPEPLVNIAHFPIFNELGALERLTAVDLTPALIARCPLRRLQLAWGPFLLILF